MVKRIWICLVLSIFLLTACAQAAATPATDSYAQRNLAQGAPAAAPSLGEKSSGANAPAADQGSGGQAAEIKRLVIKNADLSIVVPDPAASLDYITKLADGMGGYVVTSNLYKTRDENGNELPAGKISIRVPAEKLNDAMTQIKGQVKDPNQDVKFENVTGEDVTKDYTDAQSRLTNLQAKEKQLKEIMDSATKTEDVLAVFQQLTATQQEIEVLQGQIKYYEESAALSAISVELIAQASVQPPLTIGSWQPGGVARDAVQALINALKFMGNALIWLGLFCFPIFIILGIPAFFIWRGVRRWRKSRKMLQPAPKVPPASGD